MYINEISFPHEIFIIYIIKYKHTIFLVFLISINKIFASKVFLHTSLEWIFD